MSKNLSKQFTEKGKFDDCPIYDMHGHWGSFFGSYMPDAGDDAAFKGLAEANVARLVFCHHYALFCPETGNAPSIEVVRKKPNLLRAYCMINPNYPDLMKRDLEEFERLYPHVFAGFKFYPLTDVAYSDDRMKPAWEKANEHGAIVLLHTWSGTKLCDENEVIKVAERYPNAKILMGHSVHGAWDKAIEIALSFPNAFLELTAVLDERGVMERFLAESDSKKIIFGTDYPWFSHNYYIGALIGAGIEDEALRDIMYRNAKKLLGENGLK